MVNLFDLDKIHTHRQHLAAQSQNDNNFIARAIETELVDRIANLERTFDKVLINGARTDCFDQLVQVHKIHHINAYNHLCQNQAYQHVSGQSQKYDLIIDSLKIHTINDVQRYLKVNKNCLNTNGVFIAAFYGGETLRELRESLLEAEIKLYQGAALRVIPMIDIDSALKLLTHTGFNNPVVDRETLTIDYSSFNHIFRDIKNHGEADPFVNSPQAITYRHYKEAEQLYRLNYGNDTRSSFTTTVEVIYMKCEN